MDTIKTYLDNMFSSLPDTEEVRRVKDELFQMMEDKYNELKSEGKSENEAIGIVIAEFGNLDEIKEELNIQTVEDVKPVEEENKIYVTIQQAKEYIADVKNYAKYIAIATMLCIFSPIMLILLGGMSEYKSISENVAAFGGLICLFVLIAIAVGIFIFAGNKLGEYEYLKMEIIQLDDTTKAYLIEEKKHNSSFTSMKVIIGVVLCILSVIPLFFSGMFLDDFACVISVCLLLIMIGIGVIFFVTAGMESDAYKLLLQEGEYKKGNKKPQEEAISTIYWCMVTAVYLGWSFWTFKWGITWIVWPIAAVLHGAVIAVYNIIRKAD